MTAPVAVYSDVEELDPAPGIRMLEEHGFEVRVLGTRCPDRIVAAGADADVLLTGYTRVDRRLLSGLPRLRLVCTQSTGTDMVDVEAAAELGVWVANVVEGSTMEVASHALAMTLGLLRGLPFLDRKVRAGKWDASAEQLRRFSATTVGIVGMGRIGRQFASMAAPLFGEVVGYDPVVAQDDWPASAARLELDELLEHADIVTLHLPLLDSTRGLVAAPELARMRPGSFLVNVSRGELVDHAALVTALDSGHLAGAALDVLPREPPAPEDPLLSHPRLLFTPHAAYRSAESAESYVRQQAENAVAWLHGGRPLHPLVDIR